MEEEEPAEPERSPAGPRYEDAPAYAEWYAWAFQNWADPQRAHTAAAVGWASMRSGQDHKAAQAAARQAVAAGSPGTVPMAGPVVAQYAEWYLWALRELKLPSARAHVAASAAQQKLALGGTQEEAALTAQRAAQAVR